MSEPRRSRVAFVDWLRLLAALQMITGHTLDAVLEGSARSSELFATWTPIRGLTAPAFLLASGISFGLATRLDDVEAYAAIRARPGARRRRVIRCGWLVVLGTLLHALDAPWVIDVLQCVGVTLLALDLLVTLVPRPSTLVAIVSALSLGVLASALPIDAAIDERDHAGLARWVFAWIDADGGSLFPLIPWAFYVLAGLIVGRVAIPEGPRTDGGVIVARLVALTIVAWVAAWTCDAWRAPSSEDWASHPAVLFGRTGVVLGLASVLAAVGLRWELPAWGTTLAGETLALYVFHLLVLYAEGIGPGRAWAHALPWPAASALAVVMVLASAAVALGWARVWPPIEGRWLPWLRGSRLRSAQTPAKTDA